MHRIVALFFALLVAPASFAAIRSVDFNTLPWSMTPCLPAVQVVESGVAITDGQILRNIVGFASANTTPFYLASGDCVGAPYNHQQTITFEFDFPADSISLDLMNAGFESQIYVFRDQDGNKHSVPLSRDPATVIKHVILPFTSVRRMTLTFLKPDIWWSFGVDNVSFDTTPLALTFAVTEQTPEPERRVLTHKYRADDFYPSSYQKSDGRITIRTTVKAGDQPRAGVKVYFRVIDPPDAAPYVVRAGDHKENDNHDPDPLAGRLTRTDTGSYRLQRMR